MVSDLIRVIESQGYKIEKFNNVRNVEICNDSETIEITVFHKPELNKCCCCKETEKAITFGDVQRFCNEEIANKHIKVGDVFTIPGDFVVSETDDFDKINAKDVRVIAVSVMPSKVVFNFERILFRHCIDKDYVKGGGFEETKLSGYLKGKFQSALEKKLGVNVLDCSLLSKENVFEKDSEEYMPFFGERKNRIKTLLDDSDTWYWWLKTPNSANSATFCLVSLYGNSYYYYASRSDGGVAPAFAVGKIKAYRIKPEVEYVPFDTVEEFIECWNQKKFNGKPPYNTELETPLIWVKGKKENQRSLITDYHFERDLIELSYAPFNLKELYDGFTFLDGSPIGKIKE